MRFRLNRKRSLEGFAPWICEVGGGLAGAPGWTANRSSTSQLLLCSNSTAACCACQYYSPQVASRKRSSLLSAAKLAERVGGVQGNLGTDGTCPVTSLHRNLKRSAEQRTPHSFVRN